MSTKVYYSSVSGNLEMKKKQQKIFQILDSKKISYEQVDISAREDDKLKMRNIVGNSTAVPPQICKGDVYCGDFEAFEEAVECEDLEGFLKL